MYQRLATAAVLLLYFVGNGGTYFPVPLLDLCAGHQPDRDGDGSNRDDPKTLLRGLPTAPQGEGVQLQVLVHDEADADVGEIVTTDANSTCMYLLRFERVAGVLCLSLALKTFSQTILRRGDEAGSKYCGVFPGSCQQLIARVVELCCVFDKMSSCINCADRPRSIFVPRCVRAHQASRTQAVSETDVLHTDMTSCPPSCLLFHSFSSPLSHLGAPASRPPGFPPPAHVCPQNPLWNAGRTLSALMAALTRSPRTRRSREIAGSRRSTALTR